MLACYVHLARFWGLGKNKNVDRRRQDIKDKIHKHCERILTALPLADNDTLVKAALKPKGYFTFFNDSGLDSSSLAQNLKDLSLSGLSNLM